MRGGASGQGRRRVVIASEERGDWLPPGGSLAPRQNGRLIGSIGKTGADLLLGEGAGLLAVVLDEDFHDGGWNVGYPVYSLG
jgi:hypothetical protein